VTTAEKIAVFSRCQQLNDMLTAVTDLFEASSIDVRLPEGTVLEALRHTSLMDFDVHLTVAIDKYSHPCRVRAHGRPSRYRLLDASQDPQYEHLFSRIHLAVLHHKFAHVAIFLVSRISFLKSWYLPALRSVMSKSECDGGCSDG
jgi:hypothetical protein